MDKALRILLVEDEPKLSSVIQEELNEQGFPTDIAYDGNVAEKLFGEHNYSLVLLDINIPYKNGLTLCKNFRLKNKHIPIIMLTALGELQDKMDAFNLGADDYVVKPFHFDELLARIKVFIKRSDNKEEFEPIINIHDITIDNVTKTVTRAGKEISLTPKEFSLLNLLAQNHGRVISKLEILEKVWDVSFETGTNSIEVYVSFLRNKIDKPFDEKLIFTKSGFGYYIK